MKIQLSRNDFKTEILSDKAIALVSEFALIMYRQYGVLIDVNSNDVILRLCNYARHRNNRRLQTISLHIKIELCIHFIGARDRYTQAHP